PDWFHPHPLHKINSPFPMHTFYRNRLPPSSPSPPRIPSTLLFKPLTSLLSSNVSSASADTCPAVLALAGAGAICARHSSARARSSLTQAPMTPSPPEAPPPPKPMEDEDAAPKLPPEAAAPAARLSTSLTHASTAT